LTASVGEAHQWAIAHFLFPFAISGVIAHDRLLLTPDGHIARVACRWLHVVICTFMDIEKVREIVERVGRDQGLEVVEIEFRGGGKARMLRIFIDKDGGVTHDDCANVSNEVSTILDVEDVVPGATYTLEVSSPGLDRKLSKPADFERFTGSLVKLSTREAHDGNRHFEGRLERFVEGKLTLDLNAVPKRSNKKSKGPKSPEVERKVEIALADVEKANLVPEI
jgi:ribosome maturation factor RimP